MLTFNGSNVWVTILAHKLALPGSGVKWKFQMGWQEPLISGREFWVSSRKVPHGA